MKSNRLYLKIVFLSCLFTVVVLRCGSADQATLENFSSEKLTSPGDAELTTVVAGKTLDLSTTYTRVDDREPIRRLWMSS
jgi:hypothetical protein